MFSWTYKKNLSMLWMEKRAYIELYYFTGSTKTNNLFSGIDINASDRVICAGMERDKEHDVYLLFW